MYIVNSSKKKYEITGYLPMRLRRYIMNINLADAYEIHLGVDKPVCIYFKDGRYFITHKGNITKNRENAVISSGEDIEKTLELITDASVYSLKEEMAKGFITVYGGHRVGISGSAVMRDNKLSHLKDISSLNIRIANEVIGVSDNIISHIACSEGVRNTLFISPPGAGKTTVLRDIARNLSDTGFRVGIVDERCEIAAMHNGKSSFDLGVSTDVMSGVKKSDGMYMMLRTMSPEIIITDEIGNKEDFIAIGEMLKSGVSVITSIHGRSIDEIKDKGNIFESFDTIIALSKRNGAGTVEEIIKR